MDVNCETPNDDNPTEVVKDNNLKTGNNPKEEDSAIILDKIGSKNVIDADAKTSNKDKKLKHPIVLDETSSKNTISIITDDTFLKEPGNSKVSNDIQPKNNKEAEIMIVLDETKSNNTIVIDDKDIKQTKSEDSENVVILDGNKTDSDSVIVLTDNTDSENIIILDDDEVSKLSKKYPEHSIVIDVDKDIECSIVEASSSAIKDIRKNNIYDNIFKENTLLAELIEKCLNMENTDGMSRVINKTLLAIYKDVDGEYKKSDAFRKVLTKTIMKLDLEPERKFSHLKNLCDDLKVHKAKKRVNLITLEVSKDKQSISSIPTKKRRVEAIIDLDDDNQTNQGTKSIQNNKNQHRPKEYPPIELDDSGSDFGDNCDVILLDKNVNANKENNKKARSKNKVTRKKNKKKKRSNPNMTILKKMVRNPFHISKSKSDANQTDSSNMDQDINRIHSLSDPGSLLELRHTLEPGSVLEPRHTLEPGSVLEPRHTLEPGSVLEPRHTLEPGSLLESRHTQEPGPLLVPRHTQEPGPLLVPRHTLETRSLLVPRYAFEPGPLLESRHTPDPGSRLEHRHASNQQMAMELHKKQIKNIEQRIAFLKKRVEYFEEMEVENDSATSPYVLCEQVKANIVDLYKDLCQLTGTEVTKRHEVRLQVVPGHPEGPVRCLEEFLNNNIDIDGNTPFPDMHDVIQCVCQANAKFNMNWGRTQIMNEAQALFTQFGRSMQKRRQKREWKDLMSLVKEEAPDPAELDPVLQARLLENSRLARRNEDELLSRFAQLEQGVVDPTDPELRLSIDQSGDSEESDVDTPETGDGIRIVNYPPKPNGASDNSLKFLGTIGSTVTVSGGNIVIQPTLNYGNGPNHSLRNNIQKSIASCSEISLFSSEFHRFLCKNQEVPKKHDITNHQSVNITNLCGTEITSSNILAKINSKVVQSNPSTQINENYLENITNLAKNILSLVQTDQSPKTNGITNEKINLIKTNHCLPLEATVKLTKLDLSSSFAKTNECNTHGIANCTLKANNGNLQQQNDKAHENGFHIFTHSINTKSKNDAGISGSQDNTPCENENVPFQIEIKETNDSVSEELIARATFQTDKDSDVENKEGIVKPEPLDIPSMLEELGEGFTATIFDIEDPFLVIEISDSSESEDEEIT